VTAVKDATAPDLRPHRGRHRVRRPAHRPVRRPARHRAHRRVADRGRVRAAIRVRAALLLAVAVAMVSCGTDRHAAAPTTSGSTAGPSDLPGPTPPAASTIGPILPGRPTVPRTPAGTDKARVLAVYSRFWQVASTVDAQPRARWRPLLAAVTGEPLLSSLLAGYEGQAAAGQRQYGEPVLQPTVVALTADRASILDCQDASRTGLSDVDTGLPETVGQPRTPASAVLTRGGDGTWRVVQARYLEGQC
jgi:hypothetical protein